MAKRSVKSIKDELIKNPEKPCLQLYRSIIIHKSHSRQKPL